MIRAWNFLGGELRIADVEPVAEWAGVSDADIELLMLGLEQVRDHLRQRAQIEAEARARHA